VLNQEYWRETVTVLFNTIVQLKKELGIEFEFMNIGGGLGIPYRPDQETVDIVAIAQILRDVFDEAMKTHGLVRATSMLCELLQRVLTHSFAALVDIDPAPVHGERTLHDWPVRLACDALRGH